MAMLAAFLAAQFALVFAGSHGSKVTLECYHCRAIIAACGNETVSRETERCQAVALRECRMKKLSRPGAERMCQTYQLFGVN